jgi:hypothetical protein
VLKGGRNVAELTSVCGASGTRRFHSSCCKRRPTQELDTGQKGLLFRNYLTQCDPLCRIHRLEQALIGRLNSGDLLLESSSFPNQPLCTNLVFHLQSFWGAMRWKMAAELPVVLATTSVCRGRRTHRHRLRSWAPVQNTESTACIFKATHQNYWVHV